MGSGPGTVGEGVGRRVIPQRTSPWARRAADLLAGAGLTPNAISVGSVVAASVGAVCLAGSGWVDGAGTRAVLLVVAAVCIPLRLLMNMLDGMLAVEKGMHGPTGDLYNEVPDRLADALLLAGAGYAVAGVWTVAPGGGPVVDLGVVLGWVAALAAVMTAYVRSLGAANGVGNVFTGPLAKPHRMWVLAAGCLLSLAEPLLPGPRGTVLLGVLALVAVGSVVTVVRRLARIAAALRERA